MTQAELLLVEALMSDATDAPVGLAELLVRPAWMRDALCREHPEVSFFPDLGEQSAAAKAICSACLCQVECLDYALTDGIEHGVWGGTAPRARQALRRSIRAA